MIIIMGYKYIVLILYIIDNFFHERLYFALKDKILKDKNCELYQVGDCVTPRMIE